MKKALLSLLIVLFTFGNMGTVSAQALSGKRPINIQNPGSGKLQHRAPLAGLKRIDAKEGQQWFGYWSEEEPIGSLGVEAIVDYNLAIFIPGNLAKSETTINAVRFMLQADNVSDMMVWASSNKPMVPTKANLATKEVADYKPNEICDVAFDDPVIVPANGIYVGVYFKVTKLESMGDSYPILINQTSTINNGSFLYQIDYKNDFRWYDDSSAGWQLTISALTEGDFYSNSASISNSFPLNYAVKGSNAYVPVTLTNYGTSAINNISYTITADGKTTEEKTLTLSKPVKGLVQKGEVSIPFPAAEKSEEQTRTLTITKVNNESNENSSNTATGVITTIDKAVASKPVVEEFTGIWCGYCPRGAVGLELLNEKYGDKIITLAAHNGDVLDIQKYYFGGVSGFPSARINRGSIIDPYYDIETYAGNAVKAISPVHLYLKANWTDDTANKIKIENTATFYYNQEEGSYGVAYVLVENGMTGEGPDWWQANYYAGTSETDPNLQPLCEKPSYIQDMVYDHVVVDAWDAKSGVEGSIKMPITAGKGQTHSYTVDITENTIIQNKENLTLVAMLIDHATGKILNAAKCKILKQGETAIENVKELPNAEVTRYSIDGRMASKSQKGLIITRMADGSYKKVLVK